MTLQGAKVTRVDAQVSLVTEHADRLAVATEFGVTAQLADGSRALYYSPGEGVADVPPLAGKLDAYFEFLALDQLREALRDMRDAGYEGPEPLEERTMTWNVDPAVTAAQQRLDDRGQFP